MTIVSSPLTEEKKFESKDELEEWLKIQIRGIDKDDASKAADHLFAKKLNKPSRLLGITFETLQKAGLEDPLALELSNKLKEQQQQQQQQQQHVNFGESVFVLYRSDDDNADPIGTASQYLIRCF